MIVAARPSFVASAAAMNFLTAGLWKLFWS